jgi:hypothetical protein
MSNLRNLRNLFSSQVQLSVNELQIVRGGAAGVDPFANVPAFVTLPDAALSALDDNKRPERPGGGVSTH